MTRPTASANRAPQPSGLAEVLDLVLDKGIVIDAYVRVALVGIELLTIDARVVIASVDTYLRFAEAVNRLDLEPAEPTTVPELLGEAAESAVSTGAKHVVEHKLEGVAEKAKQVVERVTGKED
jgi:hypothetical protein